MESRNRYVFCETCADFVYDHGLERLCGPAAKYEQAGELQPIDRVDLRWDLKLT